MRSLLIGLALLTMPSLAPAADAPYLVQRKGAPPAPFWFASRTPNLAIYGSTRVIVGFSAAPFDSSTAVAYRESNHVVTGPDGVKVKPKPDMAARAALGALAPVAFGGNMMGVGVRVAEDGPDHVALDDWVSGTRAALYRPYISNVYRFTGDEWNKQRWIKNAIAPDSPSRSGAGRVWLGLGGVALVASALLSEAANSETATPDQRRHLARAARVTLGLSGVCAMGAAFSARF